MMLNCPSFKAPSNGVQSGEGPLKNEIPVQGGRKFQRIAPAAPIVAVVLQHADTGLHQLSEFVIYRQTQGLARVRHAFPDPWHAGDDDGQSAGKILLRPVSYTH